MLYNTQHLYFILPLGVLCSASLFPRVPRAGFLSFAPFFFYAASDAGFSLSGAPHVRAADTLSIASGLNPDIGCRSSVILFAPFFFYAG